MAYKPNHHLRKSQAITTFGPGAIVDLRDISVMMGGIDYWPDEDGCEIHEPNLEKVLKVELFKSPSSIEQSGNGKDLPYTIFPRWLVCPQCHRLAPVTLFSSGLGTTKKGLRCPDCNKRVYPARLIVACRHGHIDDFPWIEWIRHGKNPCNCDRPALELTSAGRTASLADIIVRCKNEGCGGWRNLSGATEAHNLNFMSCEGNRPWLMDNQPCGEMVIPLQRGASNVYFPVVTSALSIPPWSKAIQRVLDPKWTTLRSVPDSALKPTIEGMNLPAQLGLLADEIVQAVKDRKHGDSQENEFSEKEIRKREFQALLRPQKNLSSGDDFVTRSGVLHSSLEPYFSRVVLVDRLREVRALVGFTRITSPDPQSRLETGLVPLSRNRKNWLPAIEVHGEGIFLEFSSAAVDKWLGANCKGIIQRADILNKNYQDMCNRREWDISRKITPLFLLVHSFAHALIRQLSVESGYSSAALRERLFVFDQDGENSDAAGILIYTSSPGSEGSLGGLVRQGETERLALTIKAAINEANWCSSDPLCIESLGQGHDALNLSACHACLLLSETCCEEYNRLLDRAMLTGTLDHPEYGFFNNLVEI
jgi:hypothetical protein